MSDGGSASSVVEDGDGQIEPQRVESDCNSSYKIVSVHNNHTKIDTNRIREAIKRRRDTAANKKFVEEVNAEIDSEAWIERELEHGIELEYSSSIKKQRKVWAFELKLEFHATTDILLCVLRVCVLWQRKGFPTHL